MTILFITHDLNIVRRICRRVVVLYRGEIVESGLAEEIYRAPAHPYTELLLNSAPDGDTVASEKAVADIGEGVPAGFRGCFFYPRCPKRCDQLPRGEAGGYDGCRRPYGQVFPADVNFCKTFFL